MEIDDKYRDPIDLFTEIVLTGREVLYCCGYPRSGTTWLTRLLAECLDSPALSWSVKNDVRKPEHRDPAVEGLHRRGAFVVRHGHWKRPERNPAQERIVVIHRDPRDVALSAFHYFNFHGGEMKKVVDQMCGQKGIGLGFVNVKGRGWAGYVDGWFDDGVIYVRYEDLLADTQATMTVILNRLRLPSVAPLSTVIERHLFANRARDKTMRKGVSGGWLRELEPAFARQIEALCRPEMERLHYL